MTQQSSMQRRGWKCWGEHTLHKYRSICVGNGFYYTVTNVFIVCRKHSKIILSDIRPSTVTWDASLTSQSIFSMFCGCQNIAWKTFRRIYFDTVEWCLNFRNLRMFCCAFSHWDCILCISGIPIMQKICSLTSLF